MGKKKETQSEEKLFKDLLDNLSTKQEIEEIFNKSLRKSKNPKQDASFSSFVSILKAYAKMYFGDKKTWQKRHRLKKQKKEIIKLTKAIYDLSPCSKHLLQMIYDNEFNVSPKQDIDPLSLILATLKSDPSKTEPNDDDLATFLHDGIPGVIIRRKEEKLGYSFDDDCERLKKTLEAALENLELLFPQRQGGNQTKYATRRLALRMLVTFKEFFPDLPTGSGSRFSRLLLHTLQGIGEVVESAPTDLTAVGDYVEYANQKYDSIQFE